MKKIALLLLGVCLIIQAWGQVSDNDVIQMVLTAQKQGMSQQQIAVMLLQKGVTKEQLLRLKDTYEKGELNLKDAGNVTTDTRIRQLPLKQNDKKTDSRYLKEDELTGKPLFEAPWRKCFFHRFDWKYNAASLSCGDGKKCHLR